MIFKNREEAGHLLANKLAQYKAQNPLVLAVPRGAIKMAAIIQESLMGELGVILVRKIGSPDNEEFAIGSIGLSGIIQRQPYFKKLGIDNAYIETEGKRQLNIIKERFKNYGLNEKDYQNLYRDRIVIIIDDGIATGATMLAAIAEVRTQKPKKIIVAVAVSSKEAIKAIKKEVDEFIAVHIPNEFHSVSEFYQSFPQISDETVINILKFHHTQ